jgi:uncharacterized surface protein with fasciclin (FAS1) repeats
LHSITFTGWKSKPPTNDVTEYSQTSMKDLKMKLLPLVTLATAATFSTIATSIALASPALNKTAGNTDFSSFRNTNENSAQSQSSSSIAATVQATPSLSTLLAVAQFVSTNNDLVELLAKPGNLTVFAPSNAAFDALAVELTGDRHAKATQLLTERNKAVLRSVIQYHVLTSRVTAASIPFGKPIAAAQGSILKIDLNPGPVITDGQHRKTRISKVDIGASNGVVHLVDRVLLPS